MKIYKVFGALAVLIGIFLGYQAVTSTQGISAFTVVASLAGLLCAGVFIVFGFNFFYTKND